MRARNIKPGFFMNEEIGDIDPEIRLLFIGLWCMADRDGYLKYRPKRICAEIFPYDQTFIDKVSPWLSTLADQKLIRFWYEKTFESEVVGEYKSNCNSESLRRDKESSNSLNCNYSEPLDHHQKPIFIEIVNFTKHQSPHRRESESEIKPLIDRYVLGLSKDEPRRPERGMRNEERGMRSITARSSKQQSSEPKEKKEPILSIPLNKKNTKFQIFDEDISQWQETFPGVDVISEIKRCRLWSIDNPKRRKTLAGIRNHISIWLGKEQDRTRGQPQQSKTARQTNIDQISAVRKAVEGGTGFNPYKETSTKDGCRNVDQNFIALSE